MKPGSTISPIVETLIYLRYLQSSPLAASDMALAA